MGRGNRQGTAGPRPAWSWQEESLPAGELFSGPGRDGQVLFLAEPDWLLRLDDGSDYDLGDVPRPPAESLWLTSGETVFAAHEGRLWRFAEDESESVEIGKMQSVAVYPSEGDIRFVYLGAEGTMYMESSEEALVPHSEFVLTEEPASSAAVLAAPGSGGLALLAGGQVHYFGPEEVSWRGPEEGEVQIVGDPHNPFIAALSDRQLFLDGKELTLPSVARDWHIWQQAGRRLAVALCGEQLLLFEDGQLQKSLDGFSNTNACRLLPGGELLLGGEDGLWVAGADGQRQKLVSSLPADDIFLAVHDESRVEVVSGRTLWRGEI